MLKYVFGTAGIAFACAFVYYLVAGKLLMAFAFLGLTFAATFAAGFASSNGGAK